MKRLNPQTNLLFQRGDTRADGRLFNNYSTVVKKDGYFKEIWLTADALKRSKQADIKNKMKKYQKKSTRFPKGTRHYFKNDMLAQIAYKSATTYINQCPDYTMERLKEITANAPYVLKIIFPEEAQPDYKAIFEEAKLMPPFGY